MSYKAPNQNVASNLFFVLKGAAASPNLSDKCEVWSYPFWIKFKKKTILLGWFGRQQIRKCKIKKKKKIARNRFIHRGWLSTWCARHCSMNCLFCLTMLSLHWLCLTVYVEPDRNRSKTCMVRELCLMKYRRKKKTASGQNYWRGYINNCLTANLDA